MQLEESSQKTYTIEPLYYSILHVLGCKNGFTVNMRIMIIIIQNSCKQYLVIINLGCDLLCVINSDIMNIFM